MRLIDADAFREWWLENGANEYIYDTNSILDSIDSWPTLAIDAVPVVRCKDCKSYKKSGEYEDENGEIKEYWYCEFHSLPDYLVQMQSDDFCNYGEWRDEEI